MECLEWILIKCNTKTYRGTGKLVLEEKFIVLFVFIKKWNLELQWSKTPSEEAEKGIKIKGKHDKKENIFFSKTGNKNQREKIEK